MSYPAALGAPTLSVKLAKKLYRAGLRSRAAVVQATDQMLLGIKGIGRTRLAEIRNAVNG